MDAQSLDFELNSKKHEHWFEVKRIDGWGVFALAF